MVVELNWNKDTETFILQIVQKQYVKALEGYAGRILLAGVSYDRKSRRHECRIEEWNKQEGNLTSIQNGARLPSC